MNPFDLKSVLLAKHAQHVALVHFPIALIFISVAFDLLSLRKQSLALPRCVLHCECYAISSVVGEYSIVRNNFYQPGNKAAGRAVNQSEEKHMNTKKAFITLGLLLAFGVTLPSARADENDQATKLTFNQPVQIPGHVLPTGTYWFMLANTQFSRNIVEIYNSDRSTVIATVLTIDTHSATIPDQTAITFAEREPMQPETILSWVYPGRTSGHQFVYSTKEAQELAQVKHRTIVAKAQNKHQVAVAGD